MFKMSAKLAKDNKVIEGVRNGRKKVARQRRIRKVKIKKY